MSERALQTSCVEELRKLGAYVVKIHGGPHGAAGTPDLLCCYRGRFVAIEVKNPARGGRSGLTVLQQKAIERILAAGGVAVTVRSRADLDALITQLQEPA